MKDKPDDSKKEPSQERAALLLIHGIGEQSPYQILDQFARGMIRYQLKENFVQQTKGVKPTLEAFATGINNVSGVSLRLTGLPFKQLDFYEYYWADKVQGRITWYKSLWFLIRTGFASLNFRKQLPILLEPSDDDVKRRSPLLIVAQEVLTALLLLLVIAVLVTLVVIVGVRSPEVFRAAREFAGDLLVAFRGVPWPRGILGTLFLLFGTVWFYLIANVVLERWQSWRIAAQHSSFNAQPWHGMSSGKLKQWLPYSLVVFALVTLVQVVLFLFVQNDVRAVVTVLADFLKTPGIPWGTALLLLGAGLRWFLVYYIGDIVLYVTTDPKSPHYETRCIIRDTCSDTLRSLLKQDYDAVYLLGHSLGSVIAYDALNELSKDLRLEAKTLTKHTASDLGAHKLKGLLTFGSPLDKVFYFFRDDVSDEEAVRSQLLSFVYSSRKRKSKRDYGQYKFETYEAYFQDLYWVNLYSHADLISGHLDFYTVDKQCAMPFWNPLAAHGEYWRSLTFYEWVSAWLVNAGSPENKKQAEVKGQQQDDEINKEAFIYG